MVGEWHTGWKVFKEKDIEAKQEPIQTTTLNTESENLGTESELTEKDIQTMEEKEKSKQPETENNPDEIVKNETEQTEGLKEKSNVPLDIKELKAIADLAKRLQGGGQQRT